MPRRRANADPPSTGDPVADYRHADKRKHIPPAGLAAQGRVQEVAKIRYAYDPHLPPVLLARALRSVVDADRFAAFSCTRSLPFAAGEHGRIAVKVIDPRGNEVMRVMGLGETRY